jgi:hypothetical protein
MEITNSQIDHFIRQIGQKIQQKMAEMNINRSKLAIQTGLSREQIKWICDDARHYNIYSLAKVAIALKIDLF